MEGKWWRVVLMSAIVPGALVGVAVVAPGVGAAIEASHYPRAQQRPELGFFVASDRPPAVLALGKKLGVTPSVMTVFALKGCYCTYPSPPSTTMRLSLGVGRITPAEATTIGHRLVSSRHADTDLRIMWEMNGNWQPWGTQALSAGRYIRDWRTIVTAFRAVPGNHFTYTWDLNAGTAERGRSEFDTYPGSSWVTDVGFDYYDYHDAAAVTGVLDFAHSKGKPVEIDEWGLNGRDDPAYIAYMAGVIHKPADDVVLQSYFSFDGSIDSDILQFPKSMAAYTREFAGSTGLIATSG